MKQITTYFTFLVNLCLLSCSTGGEDVRAFSNAGDDGFEWSIPANQVFDGGVGRDGIPSIDQPEFEKASEVNTISDWEFVVVVKQSETIKAYPHNILDWHEIVNDQIGGSNFALTYCPLTGTALAWDRGTGTFGVSGLLYNSNLIPYDRISGSYWSQMLNESVRGVRVSEKANTISVIEVRWQDFKVAFPEAEVLTRNTGFSRDYDNYPYGNYRGSSDLLFPVANRDNRLFEKERVHGIQLNQTNRVYDFSAFGEEPFVYDELEGANIVLFGSREMGFMSSYYVVPIKGVDIQFTPMESPSLSAFVSDQHGNVWNVFGEVTAGPDEGIQLEPTSSYMGFFFAWAAFYPEVEIF